MPWNLFIVKVLSSTAGALFSMLCPALARVSLAGGSLIESDVCSYAVIRVAVSTKSQASTLRSR
jgi:hypothetical protein